ncbi:hypothetical protein LY13_004773 [Prauserella aidingensis]|nr:hypothetical protein [Prauserella aidingensis]
MSFVRVARFTTSMISRNGVCSGTDSTGKSQRCASSRSAVGTVSMDNPIPNPNAAMPLECSSLTRSRCWSAVLTGPPNRAPVVSISHPGFIQRDGFSISIGCAP